MINDSNNNSDLDMIASAIDEDSSDIMSEPFIPAKILNLVMPSIPLMPIQFLAPAQKQQQMSAVI